MITRVSSVIRPKGSDLIFDHPYNAESARLSMPLTASGAEHISASSVPAVSGTELASINPGYLHIRTRRLASRGRRGALCPQGRDHARCYVHRRRKGRRRLGMDANHPPGDREEFCALEWRAGRCRWRAPGPDGGIFAAVRAGRVRGSGSCPGLSSRSLRARCRDRSRTRSGRCRGEAGSPWH